MASFIGFGMTVLTLAQLAGAEVEEDPRSADFGKIKIGNLRIDIWAGFQQPVRMMAQVISGQRKSTSTGVVKKLSAEKFPYQTRGDVVSGFARSKLAPTSGLLVNILTGQTMMGEELTFKKELFEHTIPLYIQDINEIYRDEGIDLTGTAAVLALFGVGVQYYGGKTNVVMKSLKDGL